MLVLVVVAAVVAAGAWYTVQTGGLLWLVFALVVGAILVIVMRPVFHRRRVDADGPRRQVGHDDSWTNEKEEE